MRELGAWRPPEAPGAITIEGAGVRIEPLGEAHAPTLHAGFATDDRVWTYLGYGPFADARGYADWVRSVAGRDDPRFFALVPRPGGAAAGVASLMRIDTAMGVIEVGHVCLGPAMQRTPAATEAIHLLADWAFGAGYRRFEWKCDARNAASRRAAARLGFAYEGVFRQAAIVKGRNRDTAWFAIVDRDWPEIAAAHRRWLDPANFDADGRQRVRLGDLTEAVRLRAEAEHGEVGHSLR